MNKNEHILLLPFMAHGHLRPFLHLAVSLSSRPHLTITLLTTPLNATILRNHLTATPNIIITELPFDGTQFNLPPNVENTDKLPFTHVINLFHSSTSLEPHLVNYLKLHLARHHRPPVAIIFDNFLGWADSVAREFNTVGVTLTTGGAYGTIAYISIWGNLPHRKVAPNEEFSVPGFPDTCRFRKDRLHGFARVADGDDIWSRFFQPQIKMARKCSGWLVNSVEEVETVGFSLLRKYLNVPVWGVGPLISLPRILPNDECIKWLDSKNNDSVLFISFGSQNTISPTEMMELGSGLGLSGKEFLWVVRPPVGFDINGEFKPEWMPRGFNEMGRGMVVEKWGPQLEILGHAAVGGFLSHCGWNSVLEGLREGVPIIGWPIAAEQSYNAKMLVEEMGVAVEFARGVVTREEVERVVGTVLDRTEGSVGWEMKRKAVEAGRKLRDAVKEVGEVKGSSIKAVDDFLEYILSRKLEGNPE